MGWAEVTWGPQDMGPSGTRWETLRTPQMDLQGVWGIGVKQTHLLDAHAASHPNFPIPAPFPFPE